MYVKSSVKRPVVISGEYDGVTPWSDKTPELYYINTTISGDGISDDLIERIGFRVVTVDKRRLYINGEPVYLKGYNRHEDYALVGCAIPVQLMASDLDIIQDTGANAIRTCHYPNDERFLDMCDERGIFVWEENHARGLTVEQMKNPYFEQQCEDCITEMIENHYNHPSIVIWLFADCRITESRLFMSRPKCQNNKGIVDMYRCPKLAYDTVKKLFKGEKL